MSPLGFGDSPVCMAPVVQPPGRPYCGRTTGALSAGRTCARRQDEPAHASDTVLRRGQDFRLQPNCRSVARANLWLQGEPGHCDLAPHPESRNTPERIMVPEVSPERVLRTRSFTRTNLKCSRAARHAPYTQMMVFIIANGFNVATARPPISELLSTGPTHPPTPQKTFQWHIPA